jgi:hypothetical protein
MLVPAPSRIFSPGTPTPTDSRQKSSFAPFQATTFPLPRLRGRDAMYGMLAAIAAYYLMMFVGDAAGLPQIATMGLQVRAHAFAPSRTATRALPRRSRAGAAHTACALTAAAAHLRVLLRVVRGGTGRQEVCRRSHARPDRGAAGARDQRFGVLPGACICRATEGREQREGCELLSSALKPSIAIYLPLPAPVRACVRACL